MPLYSKDCCKRMFFLFSNDLDGLEVMYTCIILLLDMAMQNKQIVFVASPKMSPSIANYSSVLLSSQTSLFIYVGLKTTDCTFLSVKSTRKSKIARDIILYFVYFSILFNSDLLFIMYTQYLLLFKLETFQNKYY